jgi:hypothetical protein
MDHRLADTLADALGGVAVRGEEVAARGGEWIVIFERPDGRLVVLSDTSVDEYGDREAFEAGHCYATISLL